MIRILFASLGCLVALYLGLVAYNAWRQSIFQIGYEQGAIHTAAYVICSGWTRLPSQAFRYEAYRFVNSGMDDNCAWVTIIRMKVGEPNPRSYFSISP